MSNVATAMPLRLPTAGTKTTLSFSTAPMDASSEAPFPTDQTDDASNFVEPYVDFSEYHKAIETHGEDFVLNSVQL